MFKFLRNLELSGKPVFRPPTSALRQSGQIGIQRVRFVRPIFFTRKRARNWLTGVFLIGTSLVYAEISNDENEQQRDAGSIVENIAQEAREKRQKATGGYVPAEEVVKSVMARREGVSGNGGGSDQDKAEGENGVPGDVRDEEEQYKAEAGYEEEEGEEEEDYEDEEEEEEEEEEEVDEDSISQPIPENTLFIPLGWVRKRRPPYYKGSSPEWQSFLELTNEPKRVNYIRHELAGLVSAHSASIHWFRKKLGVPIIGTKYWLDIEFPDRPPPVYERRGLEIAMGSIAWTTRPLHPWQYSRLKTLLWPTPVVASLWTSCWTFWSLRLAKAKDYLNIKSKQEDADPNPPAKLFDRWIANRKQESQPSPGVDGSGSSKDAPTGEPSKSSAKRASFNVADGLPQFPTLPEPGKDMRIAFKAFRRSLARDWRLPEIPEEPGTCLITGTVELVGPKAICNLDVQAWYHPKESRWISVKVLVRRIQDRKQRPKR